MNTGKGVNGVGVNSPALKWLRFVLLFAVPAGFAGCASAQSGKLIDFDPNQAYSFSGTVRGEDLTGVVQFTGDDYRMYSSNGMCNGVPRRLAGDAKSSTVLDLRCGSLGLRLWLVDGQLQTEGTASLTKVKRIVSDAGPFNKAERTTHTGRVSISRQ